MIDTQEHVDDAAPGSYRIAPNLFLDVQNERSRQWLFVWKANGKRRYAGLGSAGGAKGAKITLVEARRKADALRAAVANNRKRESWRKIAQIAIPDAATVAARCGPWLWRAQSPISGEVRYTEDGPTAEGWEAEDWCVTLYVPAEPA